MTVHCSVAVEMIQHSTDVCHFKTVNHILSDKCNVAMLTVPVTTTREVA